MIARTASPGYSGTPLPAKLGLKPKMRLLTVNEPSDWRSLLADAPADLVWLPRLALFDCAIAFASRSTELKAAMDKLEPRLAQNGMIWAAWPKKASGAATDLTEDGVRRIALDIGLVDVKVCAIDATWSGLKLVRRLKDRR